jgi:hypothetical protein
MIQKTETKTKVKKIGERKKRKGNKKQTEKVKRQ